MTYHCAGSLISKHFVLTTGSCLDEHTNPKNSNSLIIQLGRTNFRSIDENTQTFYTKQVIYHPNYVKKNFVEDAALLKLSKPAKINEFVRPICLWENHLIPTTEVLVPGFDFDASTYTGDELHTIKMKLVGIDKCKETDLNIEKKTSLICGTFYENSTCLGEYLNNLKRYDCYLNNNF